jgi:hypothetical protein
MCGCARRKNIMHHLKDVEIDVADMCATRRVIHVAAQCQRSYCCQYMCV